MSKGTNIAKYHSLANNARDQEAKTDWAYAAKLWKQASVVAAEYCWKAKITWCENRADFCDGMLRRAKL